MTNKISCLLFVCSSFLSLTCKKKSDQCHWYVPPPAMIFEIEFNNKFIVDSDILSSIKVYYYQENLKKYVSDLTVSDTILADSIVNRVVTTKNIPGKSGSGTKIFYVEYPISLNKGTDTLFVDYSLPNIDNNCQYHFNQIKYNNNIPPINTAIKLNGVFTPIYIFNHH